MLPYKLLNVYNCKNDKIMAVLSLCQLSRPYQQLLELNCCDDASYLGQGMELSLLDRNCKTAMVDTKPCSSHFWHVPLNILVFGADV